jgi:hypothetical protein
MAAFAHRAETAQIELRLDRHPPELTIEISAKDMAATVGVPLAPGEPMAALTEQRLAAVDHRLAAAIAPLVQLRVSQQACQAEVERQAVPSPFNLYQRLLLRWHCPAHADGDNWSLDFRLLTDPDVGHVAAGNAVLPDGSRQPLLFDGREQARGVFVQAPASASAMWLPASASASALGLAVCVLLASVLGARRDSLDQAD